MRGERSLADWLSWQETLHPNVIDLGLDRVRRTLERLGWRRPACPIVIVGGTNGKGSSVVLTASILRASGRRVGVFTSPHLRRYQERIVIDGREAADASLIAAFQRIDAARGEDTLTFFEFNTLAALLIFETAGLDAIVLEVGMGGRLDAVNVVDADVALITSIALDHREWLGSDVEAIGREKAGIFRRGRPAVFGARVMPASIADVAAEVGARLLRLGRDFEWTRAGERWTWRSGSSALDSLPPPALFGEAQFDNAAAVLCVLEQLSTRLDVDRNAIEQGLTDVRLPGRFQIVRRRCVWVLDVAHNPAAAATLAAQLRALPIPGRTIGVCGMLADKDIEGAAAALAGVIDVWIVAGLAGPRALEPKLLAERLQRAGANVASVAAHVASACVAAEALARPDDRVIVFGSFLTVGAALEYLDAVA